jgi:hypothetical protein
MGFEASGKVQDLYLKVLLHGLSGAGKTYTGARTERVAVCACEAQAVPVVRMANPFAILPNLGDGRHHVESMNEVRAFTIAAVNGTLTKMGVDTLFFDSITEIQRLMMDEILKAKGFERDDGAGLSMADWGVLAERLRGFLRTLRDLPFNVLVSALSNRVVGDDGKVVEVVPLVKGRSLHNEIAGYFNAVGYVLKRDATADVVLNQLWRFTPMQTSFGCNMLALNGGRPEQMDLRTMLSAFLTFREEVVAGDLRGVPMRDPMLFDDLLKIAGRLCGQPDNVMAKLSVGDLLEVAPFVAGFIGGSPPTGTAG